MRKILLPLLAVLAAACSDESATMVAPPQPTEGSVAFMQFSNVHPTAGSTVIVTARVSGAMGVSTVGSFSARLQFDTTALEYAGENAVEGGMRMLSAKSGEVRAAGASQAGFTDGTLFAVTFKVRDPAALQSLHLDVTELTGVDFGAQLSRLAVDRRVFAR